MKRLRSRFLKQPGIPNLKRGVTLLEVLLAVSIAASVLGLYLRGISQTVRSQKSLEESYLARSLANDQILQIRFMLQSGGGSSSELQGIFNSPFDFMSWKANIFPGGEDGEFDLLRFTVYEKKGKDGIDSSIYSVETLLPSR